MTEPSNWATLKSFLDVAHRWQLDQRQQATLLGVDLAEIDQLTGEHGSSALSDETVARMTQIRAIDACLQVLLPVPERADSWVHQPNAAPIFEGRTALGHMMRGRLSDLREVADYLASFCSGDFS